MSTTEFPALKINKNLPYPGEKGRSDYNSTLIFPIRENEICWCNFVVPMKNPFSIVSSG